MTGRSESTPGADDRDAGEPDDPDGTDGAGPGADRGREAPSGSDAGAGNGDGETDADGTVVAQGTFDILHPGHVHYLREAAAMGDRLVAIVARSENVTHKQSPVLSGRQRRRMVAALDPVDEARLGHPEDIFVPIERIDPAVIALGYDQHHDPDRIEARLADRGIDCSVRRASGRDPGEGELLSTQAIVERILEERG